MKLPVTDKAYLERRKVFGLNPNVFFLGMVSLLTDVSSEMIFTLVPLFLSNVLGAATTIIGLVGGLSESTDAIFRIFSGWFSDRVGKRKPLAVLGYSMSTIAKPFMYLAASWGSVLAIRFGDRVGKGIRTSPRDALVADSVAAGERGRGFGLHRAMDTTGAVLGLAIAAVIIYLVQGGELALSLKTYQWLVVVGVVPAVLAVLALLFFVREMKKPPPGGVDRGLPRSRLTAGFDTRFKVFLAIMAVFTLGNSSDFFVILRAQNLGSSVIYVVLMLVVLNVTYSVTSLPAGILSDRLGRRRVITLGWFIYALVYLGFAVASETWQVWLLFACYGIYYGVVEGVARAFVADLVPEEKRGTAFGLYHGVVGLTLLPASLLAGWLWQAYSPAAPFFFGAGLAFLAMLGIMGLVRE
ncbi:MAG: MFS transporter [Dehalococcoidia bacterium]|nr:MFS transporter [Dehalococcoidia bacterium]